MNRKNTFNAWMCTLYTCYSTNFKYYLAEMLSAEDLYDLPDEKLWWEEML